MAPILIFLLLLLGHLDALTPFDENQKIKYIQRYSKRSHGCLAVENMVDFLKPLHREGILVDIGANIGDVSATFLTAMNDLEIRSFPWDRVCSKITRNPIPVVAVEAFPPTYDVLRRRSLERNWTHFGFEAFNFAVSNEDGIAEFYGSTTNEKDSEQSSLSKEAVFNGKEPPVSFKVQKRKLDSFFAEKNIRRVFILKIDTEGFDSHALEGASEFLNKKRARFVSFEHGWKWAKSTSKKLSDVNNWLSKLGYACFIIRSTLIPIYHEWFHESYNVANWENIFCMQFDDPNFDLVSSMQIN